MHWHTYIHSHIKGLILYLIWFLLAQRSNNVRRSREWYITVVGVDILLDIHTTT